MTQKTFDDIVLRYLGHHGAMVSGSKSRYMKDNPHNKVVFNANVVIPVYGKIWYGDIDITKSKKNLIDFCKKIDTDLYILYELDFRFEKEGRSLEDAIAKVSKYYKVTKESIVEVNKKGSGEVV